MMNNPACEAVMFSGSRMICDGPCMVWGWTIGTDGSNNPTLTFYKNKNGSGGADGYLIKPKTMSATARDPIGMTLPAPIYSAEGVYLDVSCAGAVTGEVYITRWH